MKKQPNRKKGDFILNYIKALFIKFIMISAVLGVVLTLLYKQSFSDTLLISAILTVAAFLLGDLLIFRGSSSWNRKGNQKKRNVIATFSDALLAFFVIWFAGKTFFPESTDMFTASLISALVIAAGEWFFHKYLDNRLFS